MTAIARWIWIGMARSVAVGALWLLFLSAPLLASVLLSSHADGPESTRLLLAWVFPAALLGCGWALVSLSQGGDFLARIAPRTRWGGELLALTGAATYLQLPVALAACATGARAADLTEVMPAILTLDLRLAAVALLLLVPPLPTTLRLSLFLAAAWLVPALASGSPGLGRLAASLDAGAGLEPDASLPTLLALTGGLLLPGYLLRTRSAAAGTR